ncbi:electron transport complex subunit RsxC [Ewingella americana]|uniref:Ion-translocating oxidoreductase complex subunit C n=1 Tax=Ewingella americana (strain ATCC 33852 / DSM 4580 / CCUG 14506 / JCM 5911 / LMG 7869 / NCTC 12157 / CDC 1468-78) TaxID=910964 RepID=A0A085GE26_EWIA3|nr:electron transport complex subunit RsxC [Ewingella americana]KAA8729695.1 electron transport complex subunit RsxC [Ewingella americana]KFC81971.1 RnfC family electron transport complex protein [Ewingella americana ATCC 33852]
MFNLFSALKKDKLWDFDGGIHPPEMKTQSSHVPLRRVPLSERFIIPLQQHLGPEGELCVKSGDRALKGQPLTTGRGRTVPVHAPTSGVITAIEPHITAHPSGLKELCILISADGEDRWCERDVVTDYHQLDAAELNARIHQAGIAGLGGAGFPTASKLQGGLTSTRTLILNAAECEPYITADDRLMQEHAAEILEGTRILCHMLKPERVLIGIEDNKPEAISALKQAIKAEQADGVKFELRVVPTKYPSGGAKQLTKILTGLEVPKGHHSSHIGVLMQNVGTVFAIKRAIIDGEPLIERVVTLTGEAMEKPGNVWARIGMPISHLMVEGALRPQGPQKMVIMGGPLMGFTLPSLDVPVVKISNCLLAPSESEMGQPEPEEACIRCSLCADACPAGLLPQQLYWFSRGQEHEKARNHNLFDCIECGACAYVCPSNIPLVQYYRQEKAEIRAVDLETAKATEAKARFEAKQARMEREKLAREEKHQKAAVKLDTPAVDKAPVEKAVEAAASVASQEKAAETDPRQAALAAAIARAKAKKAANEGAEVAAPEAAPAAAPAAEKADNDDARKTAVAAAVARAKAKKAAATQETPVASETVATPSAPVTSDDDAARKAAVAAAIARVKAKKAGNSGVVVEATDSTLSVTTSPSEPSTDDKRKAAVAAAIARAKAKKAAAQEDASEQTAPEPTQQESDPRKAAVAAAIARVKARKAAAQTMSNEE